MEKKEIFKQIEHDFVPKHEFVPSEEEGKILAGYGIEKHQLPKIFKNDPAIKHLKPERGNIIKITRHSKTAGKAIYYRVVI